VQGCVSHLLPSIFAYFANTTLLSVFGAVTLASKALVRTWVLMMRTSFTNWAILQVACLSLLLSQCHGVFYTPYQFLPLTSFKSFNGTFGFPSGGTQIFDEGTPMTIRWSTDFVAVNLYVVYNASSIPPSAGIQKQLSSKYSSHPRVTVARCLR
jgi:hypothetical protein